MGGRKDPTDVASAVVSNDRAMQQSRSWEHVLFGVYRWGGHGYDVYFRTDAVSISVFFSHAYSPIERVSLSISHSISTSHTHTRTHTHTHTPSSYSHMIKVYKRKRIGHCSGDSRNVFHEDYKHINARLRKRKIGFTMMYRKRETVKRKIHKE